MPVTGHTIGKYLVGYRISRRCSPAGRGPNRKRPDIRKDQDRYLRIYFFESKVRREKIGFTSPLLSVLAPSTRLRPPIPTKSTFNATLKKKIIKTNGFIAFKLWFTWCLVTGYLQFRSGPDYPSLVKFIFCVTCTALLYFLQKILIGLSDHL